jgi:exonuclease III
MNVRSIMGKRDEFQAWMADHRPHVTAVTESWLTEDVLDAEIAVDGYTVHRCDRVGMGYGGVLLYVHDALKSTIVAKYQQEGTNCELLICSISVPHGPTYTVAVVYRSPSNADPRWMHLLNQYTKRSRIIVL